MVYATIKSGKKDIDNISSYIPEVEYTLPSLMGNGTRQMEVLQRIRSYWERFFPSFILAYDFFIVDEEGRVTAAIKMT